jgi:ribulose kinase
MQCKKKTYLEKRKEKRKKKFIKNVNLKKLRREKNKIEEDLHTYER